MPQKKFMHILIAFDIKQSSSNQQNLGLPISLVENSLFGVRRVNEIKGVGIYS